MKKLKIFYWIFTGLLVVYMLFSGMSGLANPEQSYALIHDHLGYPSYFIPVISWAKICGVIAIVVPGFSRLKEWAYAGFTFDLIMAIYSFVAVGDLSIGISFISFGLILVFGSYIFYHQKRKLASDIRTINVDEA
ncbi:MAG: DoxX family protein [Thermoflavifilum sp.]|nr:DoxX family protein [Thermoflavifilum sp.]